MQGFCEYVFVREHTSLHHSKLIFGSPRPIFFYEPRHENIVLKLVRKSTRVLVKLVEHIDGTFSITDALNTLPKVDWFGDEAQITL